LKRMMSLGQPFEVLHNDKGMYMRNRDGDTLNPMNLDLANDSERITASELADVIDYVVKNHNPKPVKDKVIRKSDEDREADRIISLDADHIQFLKRKADMDSLRPAYRAYLDCLYHDIWEIKKFGDIGIPEPPRGKCSKCNKASYDKYMLLLHELIGSSHIKPMHDSVVEEYRKIDNIFNDAQKEYKNRPKPNLLFMTGNGEEEE